uniref:Uncharacterized protein n=1 Tax=Heterorhabditis bacteriophora TaxID=37862 RepID=A0A1I7XEC7_HETBA
MAIKTLKYTILRIDHRRVHRLDYISYFTPFLNYLNCRRNSWNTSLSLSEWCLIYMAATDHYYQPGFTLVGGGLMTLKSNMRKQSTLIHPNSVWIKDCVERFNPKQNSVILSTTTTSINNLENSFRHTVN